MSDGYKKFTVVVLLIAQIFIAMVWWPFTVWMNKIGMGVVSSALCLMTIFVISCTIYHISIGDYDVLI